MLLAKSNIETRSTQWEFRVIYISNMPKWTEKRDFSQCKELVSPSKKRLENRVTSQSLNLPQSLNLFSVIAAFTVIVAIILKPAFRVVYTHTTVKDISHINKAV